MVSLGSQSIKTSDPNGGYGFNVGMFFLLNAAVGTHDLVLTREQNLGTMDFTVGLYTGVDQLGPASGPSLGATLSPTDSPSASITTTSPNSWIVGSVFGEKSIVPGSANVELREQSPDQNTLLDSNGPVPVGSHSISWNLTTAGNSGWVFAAFKPATFKVFIMDSRYSKEDGVHFSFQGSSETDWEVQWSNDLTNWNSLKTYYHPTAPVTVDDAASNNDSRRFYRVTSP